MTPELRPIDPSGYAAIEARGEVGPAPMLQWLKIAELVVDDSYQRPLAATAARGVGATQAGRRNVRLIAEAFDWSKFSPVIVAPVEGGRYAIIDGQHRTTAAALRGIESVPCQVVIADRAQQAAAFKSINGAVTRMSALAIQHAAAAAGEPLAVRTYTAAQAAGVTLLRYPKDHASIRPGETMAVVAIREAVAKHGEAATTLALECVTRTRNNRPGVLGVAVIAALVALVAEDRHGGREQLLAGLERIDLERELETARVTRREKGVAVWQLLKARISDQLAESSQVIDVPLQRLTPHGPLHGGWTATLAGPKPSTPSVVRRENDGPAHGAAQARVESGRVENVFRRPDGGYGAGVQLADGLVFVEVGERPLIRGDQVTVAQGDGGWRLA